MDSLTDLPLLSRRFSEPWIFLVMACILSMLANSTSTSALSSASAVRRGSTPTMAKRLP